MPTGYTAAIADGITFEQFALNCARAFGALVTMRDDPADAAIPDRIEPSDYHQRKLEETHVELDRLRAMTLEQCRAAADDAFAVELQCWQDRCDKRKDLAGQYAAMLANVEAWTPPTPDHVGLKEFMAKQIRESIDWDCSDKYDEPPERKSTDGWIAIRTAELQRYLAYHEEEYRKEVERAAQRTAWIQALKASL
jgi:hypothetical protein